jgi:protein arginine kinase
MWGEGSEVRGNLFQLSNQVTLGKSESELLEHLGRLVTEVIAHERRAREVLHRDATGVVEDRVWRAWGVLVHARALELDETLNLLGGVRLGVAMGILPSVPWRTLNRLLVEVQDAHVARAAASDLDGEGLLTARATLVRHTLQEEATR